MTNKAEIPLNEDKRYSLFQFAPREMSHSAFWAWIFYSLNARDPEFLLGPRRIASRLLKKIGISQLILPIEVSTEIKTKTKIRGERGRYDIYIRDNEGKIVVIENKVSALPGKNQLSKYLGDLGPNSKLALLSTAFDVDIRSSIPRDVPYVGSEDLMEIIGPDKDSHPVVHDYALWLQDLLEHRSRLAAGALSDDPGFLETCLGTPEGQWSLMKSLTFSMRGRQYRGYNLDGSPQTQFCFIEEDKARDMLFYRIDNSKTGAYLAIRQYQSIPYPSLQAKHGRLIGLRKAWSEALAEYGDGLNPTAPSERGAKESEIGRFLIRHNPPSTLRERLALVHQNFLNRLEKDRL